MRDDVCADPSLLLALTPDEVAIVRRGLEDLADGIRGWKLSQKKRWFFFRQNPYVELAQVKLAQIQAILHKLKGD